MDDRKEIARQMKELEQQMRELEIRYEKYFAGTEKLEPIKLREDFSRRLRFFANRRIMQTDLRFKYQNLATRYHSYAGQWDRILRLMDEGKYVRQLARTAKTDSGPPPASATNGGGEVDTLYRDLLEAHRSCRLEGNVPKREQLAGFLEKQKAALREKYGDRPVQFQVVTEDGKPKIKVRAKK